MPALRKLDNGVFDTDHEDIGALNINQGAASDPHATASSDPQADGGGSKNASDAGQQQGSERDGIIRQLLPEGFWLITLGVFFGCGGLTFCGGSEFLDSGIS